MNITELFTLSVHEKASDLHLSPGQPPIFRINGDLIPAKNIPIQNAEATKRLIYSVMEKEQQKEFEKTLELDFGVVVPNVAGFRVNVFHELNGIGAVFRIIPEKIPTLDQLDMPPVFKQLLVLPNGLILVTGPTGSGKRDRKST